MTTTTTTQSSLGFKVSLTGIARTYNVDTSLNIYRRHETISYRLNNTIEAANVAYVTSKPLISNKALHIFDRSSVLSANRIIPLDSSLRVSGIKEYVVPTDKILITDIYVSVNKPGTNILTKEPLFFKHIISKVNLPRQGDSLSIDTRYVLTDVRILDSSFLPIEEQSTEIDYDLGVVYNNLESSFDQDNNVANIYYISYSLRDYRGIITSFVELLSNENVYKQATLDDLDDTMNIINDGRKVYLVEEQDNLFKIILPVLGSYAFQLVTDARIKLLPPPQSNVDTSWNVSISNGKFLTKIGDTNYRYSIAEFNNQIWNPQAPYKLVEEEEASFVAENLAKVRQGNINTDVLYSGFVDLLIYDQNNEPLAAFTTDSGLAGQISSNSKKFNSWEQVSRVGIRSVDKKTGIIDIEGLKLRSDYKMLANYRYEENNYELTNIDFNPINNPAILNKFVSIFIDPDFNESSKQKTVYFTLVDMSGKVIKSNYPTFDNSNQLIQTEDGFWREVYHENFPDYYLNENDNVTITGAILFIPQYTVIGSGVLLPLGNISVTDYDHSENSEAIDVRVRGGGLREDSIELANSIQQETEWYNDLTFWDGYPFPGNASYYIEVPAELLEVAGGTFKSNQIREIIDRHTAGGVYAISKTYGVDPTVSGLTVGSGFISIGWRSYSDQ